MKKKLVVTVCNGNIHRSVIAQLCLDRELSNIGKDSCVEVISRGLQGTMGTAKPKYENLMSYKLEYHHTLTYLKMIGTEFPSDQKATPIDKSIVSQASLILAMDKTVLQLKQTPDGSPMSLVDQFPDYTSKMHLFTELVGKKEVVPDSFGSDDPALYQNAVFLINEVAKLGTQTIIKMIKRC